MGAMMALINNDPVKPIAGLSRAYPAWKRQHDFATAEQSRQDALDIVIAAVAAATTAENTDQSGPDEGPIE